MSKLYSCFVATLALLVLVGCGGGNGGSTGGSGGSGGGGTANSAPRFTNGASFAIDEQQILDPTNVIVQLTATDPDGDALTFEILNSNDGALFVFLGQEGALAFSAPPSFETALDNDGDNFYQVDVRVSDGSASATQAISIEVVDTKEGLSVERIATGLLDVASRGSITYLDDRNEVLVVGDNGKISVVDPATGSVSAPVFFDKAGLGRVVDIASDDLSFRGGNFFVLAFQGTVLFLNYVDISDGSSTALFAWSLGQNIQASMTMRGNDVLIAFDSLERYAYAQLPSTTQGNIVQLTGTGDPADPAAYSMTARTVAWGLRVPKLLKSSNLQGWLLDQAIRPVDGLKYNEVIQADFQIAQGDANFEFPIKDGFEDFSFSGTVQGTRVAPRFVAELVVGDVGGFVDAAESLQGNGWFGALVIAETSGKIFTYGTVNNEPFEDRTLDFTPATGALGSVISMDDGDADVGNAIPIYMLNDRGELFAADLER